MIDLFLQIFEKISAKPELAEHFDDERAELIGKGHKQSEIDFAFGLAQSKLKEIEGGSIRYLSSDERGLFSAPAYGFIMSLQMARILSSDFVELLITRALISANHPMTLEDVKTMVEFMLMNPQGANDGFGFEVVTFQQPKGEVN